MKIKLLTKEAKMPTRATNGSAGYDLYVPYDKTINPGRNVVALDFQIELDPGTEAQIRPRSGFSLRGIEGCSCSRNHEVRNFDADVLLGTIDEDYRGIVGVLIKNHTNTPFILKGGARIAQMVIAPYCKRDFEVADELSSHTERGEGGFGHSGTH